MQAGAEGQDTHDLQTAAHTVTMLMLRAGLPGLRAVDGFPCVPCHT